MADVTDRNLILPSAAPTEQEQRAWDSLSREEQLRRMQAALTSPDALAPTDTTMAEIWAELEAEFKPRG